MRQPDMYYKFSCHLPVITIIFIPYDNFGKAPVVFYKLHELTEASGSLMNQPIMKLVDEI